MPVDPTRFEGMENVRSVVGDKAASIVTVLFKNGDVLRVGENPNGCTGGIVLTARFESYHRMSEDDSRQKLKYITDLMFSPTLARGLDHSIDGTQPKFVGGPTWSFDGKSPDRIGWWAYVSGVDHLDGMGQTISMGYVLPANVDEPLHELRKDQLSTPHTDASPRE
jgi:hypothetical protein